MFYLEREEEFERRENSADQTEQIKHSEIGKMESKEWSTKWVKDKQMSDKKKNIRVPYLIDRHLVIKVSESLASIDLYSGGM